MEIFTNEFKESIKRATKKVAKMTKEATGKTVDAVGGVVEKVENSETVKEVKKKIFNKTEVDQKTYEKAMQRKAARESRQKEKDFVKAEIEQIKSNPDVEEVYSQRSRSNETTAYTNNECIVTAKVTVIGVVRRLPDGKFRLQISFSRRNPCDVYDKRLGTLTALRRAIDPHATFEIEGHKFETIKVGDFESPLLKSLFIDIADNIINEYEYDVLRFKKSLANSILAMSEEE